MLKTRPPNPTKNISKKKKVAKEMKSVMVLCCSLQFNAFYVSLHFNVVYCCFQRTDPHISSRSNLFTYISFNAFDFSLQSKFCYYSLQSNAFYIPL